MWAWGLGLGISRFRVLDAVFRAGTVMETTV